MASHFAPAFGKRAARLVALSLMPLLFVASDAAAYTFPDTPENRRRGVVGCTQTTTGITCPRRTTPRTQQPRGPTEEELQQAREMGVHELNDIGVEYYNKGDWASAINYFRAALEIDPNYPSIWDNLQAALGKRAEARAEAQRRAEAEARRRAEAQRREEAKRRAEAKARAEARARANAVATAQGKVDRIDPDWVAEIQNRSRAAIRLRRSEIAAKTRSFKMKEPPPPLLPLPLSKVGAGDIILVGSTDSLLGATHGFLQGLGEKWAFGNPNSPVTHALLYVGERSGVKMYLDSQPGSGPRIIDEAEFKRKYGGRPLFAAQPTLHPDGDKLYEVAWEYAKANAEAKRRGLPGTNFGAFGKDNIVCSESSLFALVRAQAPGRRIVVESIGGKRVLNPIAVTPGDIYNQDGKGYFTVRPMNIDG